MATPSRFLQPRQGLPAQSNYGQLQPPQKTINAHPSNAIYAPNTGKGTGTAAKKIGYMNRDGSRSAVSGLGAPTGPLSQPMPRMQDSGTAAYAQRQQNVLKAKADGSFASKQQAFNQANPGLHLHDDGHIAAHPDAEKRLATAGQQSGNDVPTNGKGGYMAPRSGPAAPAQSTVGQADSMRQASGLASGRDASSSRGDWQHGTPGTTRISSQYGSGASTIDNHVALVGPNKPLAAPVLPAGAASMRSPAKSMMAAPSQPIPSAVPPERMQQYAAANAQFKASPAPAPATLPPSALTATPQSSPMITGQRPNTSTPPSPFNAPPTTAPIAAASAGTGQPIPMSAPTSPSNAAAAASPSFMDRRIASNPDGILGKAREAGSMLAGSLRTGASNIVSTASNAVNTAGAIASPVVATTKQAGQIARQAVGSAIQSQAAANPSGLAARIAGKKSEESGESPASNTASEEAKEDPTKKRSFGIKQPAGISAARG